MAAEVPAVPKEATRARTPWATDAALDQRGDAPTASRKPHRRCGTDRSWTWISLPYLASLFCILGTLQREIIYIITSIPMLISVIYIQFYVIQKLSINLHLNTLCLITFKYLQSDGIKFIRYLRFVLWGTVPFVIIVLGISSIVINKSVLPLGLMSKCRWCLEPGVGTGLGLGHVNFEPSSSNCRTRRADGEPPAVGPNCCDDRDLAGKWRGLSMRRLASPRDEPKRLPLSI